MRCREAGLALGASLAIVQGEHCPYCLIKSWQEHTSLTRLAFAAMGGQPKAGKSVVLFLFLSWLSIPPFVAPRPIRCPLLSSTYLQGRPSPGPSFLLQYSSCASLWLLCIYYDVDQQRLISLLGHDALHLGCAGDQKTTNHLVERLGHDISSVRMLQSTF